MDRYGLYTLEAVINQGMAGLLKGSRCPCLLRWKHVARNFGHFYLYLYLYLRLFASLPLCLSASSPLRLSASPPRPLPLPLLYLLCFRNMQTGHSGLWANDFETPSVTRNCSVKLLLILIRQPKVIQALQHFEWAMVEMSHHGWPFRL